MAKKIPSMPLIGKIGLMAIIGAIVGVIVDKLLENFARENPTLQTKIYLGFHVDDLIGLLIPLGLLAVVRRYKAFFVGWFVGQLACELYEWTHAPMFGYGEQEPF